VLWTREVIVRKRISFAEMDALQDDVEQRYRVLRYCMDQTGMGEKPVEDAQTRYGKNRVEGVLFTGPNKLTLATLIKQSFEDRKSRIPMADEKLRGDLHRVRKIPSPTGAPRFDADSDANGHADRFWAKALACLAAHGNLGPVQVASRSVPGSRPVSSQLAGYLT
jgi:phage FluMu gp28-like protein